MPYKEKEPRKKKLIIFVDNDGTPMLYTYSILLADFTAAEIADLRRSIARRVVVLRRRLHKPPEDKP